jgi:hypothetical protein
MGTMIDQLLELSRVSRAEVRREYFDLSELARGLAAELKRAEPERRVEFVIADGITAHGDSALVQIVLGNRLSNAWKFTSSHAQARIEVGTTEAGRCAAYFVRDDGAGFDMAHYNEKRGEQLHPKAGRLQRVLERYRRHRPLLGRSQRSPGREHDGPGAYRRGECRSLTSPARPTLAKAVSACGTTAKARSGGPSRFRSDSPPGRMHRDVAR